MKKPRSYELSQCPASDGYMQASLNLYCEQDKDTKMIFINTYHGIELKPRSAKALAKRLLLMAEWAESEVE